MKSNKTEDTQWFDRMVEIYHCYQQLEHEYNQAPKRFTWSLQELHDYQREHWDNMVRYIPIEVEWEILQIWQQSKPTGLYLAKIIAKRLIYRAFNGIKNLHIRAFSPSSLRGRHDRGNL